MLRKAELNSRSTLVPISEISAAIGKSQQFIRIGLQKGILKFGYAYKVNSEKVHSYYCPDKLVWEQTGYFRDIDSIQNTKEVLYNYETA